MFANKAGTDVQTLLSVIKSLIKIIFNHFGKLCAQDDTVIIISTDIISHEDEIMSCDGYF